MFAVGILGSPVKDGNSEIMTKFVLEGFNERGADNETRLFYLNGMDFSGCQACNSCKESRESGCVQEDEMQEIYEALKTAELVVIGSPLYMDQVTGQLKLFMDRLNVFLNPDFTTKLPAKKTVCLYSQGLSDPGAYGDYFETLRTVYRKFGLEVVEEVVLPDAGPHDTAVNDPALRSRLREIGRKTGQ